MTRLISVIVPVYNAEKYLERCVHSISGQTYKNLEIILVNDGSSDNSGKICDKLAISDSRIKVIHQENGGSSIARNTGLENANGDILAFVDSDDHLDFSMFERMMELMNAHNLEVVEIERDDPTNRKHFDHKFYIEHKNQALERIIPSSSFQVWKRLYKKSVVEGMRFIPHIVHQDVFYIIDLMKKVKTVGYLNSPLYFYNRESESVIRSKYTALKRDVAIRATEYIRDNIPKTEELKKVMDRYIVNYYTDHFYLISKNKFLDPDKTYRKKLKKEIKQASYNAKLSLRTKLALALPMSVIELMAWGHHKYKSLRN